MLDRRLITNIPWSLLGLVAVIALFGLTAVYSATYTARGPSPLFTKQLVWMAAGAVVMFLALLPDYHTVGRYAYVLYFVSLVLLVLVMFLGRTGMGAQRWLAVGPFAFQPSELAKLSLVLALARFFAEHPKRGGYELRDLAVPGVMIAVPVLFVLKQPDLGTALMLVFTSCMVLVLAGIRLRVVVIALVAVTVAASAVLLISPVRVKIWNSFKPYQQKRIIAFIDPESDPLGSGYHASQSKIAVGSGQLTGKGFRKGTQSQMAFLPERHTDFIFSVIAEEHGFLGSSLLIVLYVAFLFAGIEAAKNAKDKLGSLMAGGLVSMFSLYVCINIGMTVGILPVVGVPLPLVSYGGTSVITTFLAVGLLLNIQSRRYMLFY